MLDVQLLLEINGVSIPVKIKYSIYLMFPSLIYSISVANKWLHEFDHEFRRPCSTVFKPSSEDIYFYDILDQS